MCDSDKILIGLTTTKEENFMDWFRQVIIKSDMIEYTDISGCYVLLPNCYALWEKIQEFINRRLKKMNVKNCYFPLLISKQNLEREKDHLEGFSPEVAWVTKGGSSDLGVPLAIRPTSEACIYSILSNRIKSHRDLPMKLNQWCSVIRWEFKDCYPLLRSREFNWSESHTLFHNESQAHDDVNQAIDLYTSVYQDLLAVPVIRGRKSEKEKFAGASYTNSTECFIPISCKSIQASTAHHLGTNFSRMFNIQVENSNGSKQFVYQNSWGITTRSLGIMTMVHGDNKGLVLPPRIAPMQVVIIPCGLNTKTTPEVEQAVMEMCDEIRGILESCSGLKHVHEKIPSDRADLYYKITAEVDKRKNYTPGHKFNHWEMRGIPLRLEIGPKDIANGTVIACRRDTGEKITIKHSIVPYNDLHYGPECVEFWRQIQAILDSMQNDMFKKALEQQNSHIKVCNNIDIFNKVYEEKKSLMLSPWCESVECENDIVEKSREKGHSIKSLCIPFDQNMACKLTGDASMVINENSKCVWCNNKAKSYTLFGSSF